MDLVYTGTMHDWYQTYEHWVYNVNDISIVAFTSSCDISNQVNSIVKELSSEYMGSEYNMVFISIDMSHQFKGDIESIQKEYDFKNIPTTILFKNDEVFYKIEGLIDKELLEEKIKILTSKENVNHE